MNNIEINMLAYKRSEDGGLTALESPSDPIESFGVYVMEYATDENSPNEELEDHDCKTFAEANAKFEEMRAKYPDADENIYSIPHSVTDTIDDLSAVQS